MGYGFKWQCLYRAALWSSVTASLAAVAVAFVLLVRYGLWGEFKRRGRSWIRRRKRRGHSILNIKRVIVGLQTAVLIAVLAAAGFSMTIHAQEAEEVSEKPDIEIPEIPPETSPEFPMEETVPEVVITYCSDRPFYLYADERRAYCAGDITILFEIPEEGIVLSLVRESTGAEEILAGGESFVLQNDDAVCLSVSGQDLAGNPAVIREEWEGDVRIIGNVIGDEDGGESGTSSYTLVRDTEEPVLFCAQKEPSGFAFCADREQDIFYYSALPEAYSDGKPALAACFAVREENADPDRLLAGYYYSPPDAAQPGGSQPGGTENGPPSGAEYTPFTEQAMLSEMELVWFSELKPGDGNTRDGNYYFAVSGTDRAGNPIRLFDPLGEQEEWEEIFRETRKFWPHAEEMGPFTMHCGDPGSGLFVSGARVVDTLAPEGIVTAAPDTSAESVYYRAKLTGDTVDTEEDCFAPYRRETLAILRLEAIDSSPVEMTFETISTLPGGALEETRTEGFVMNNRAEACFQGEQIFCLRSIVLTDRAGNRAGPFESTAEIYLDAEEPKVDLEVPAVIVRAVPEITGRTPDGQPLYGGSVRIRVLVTDPGEEESSSGLEFVTYDLKADGEFLIQDRVLFDSGRDNNGSPAVSGFADTVVVAAGEDTQSNDLEFIVHTRDLAGNSPDVDRGGYFRFGIDTEAPDVHISFDNNEAVNGHYFAAPRTARIEVAERNLDPQKLRIIAAGGEISVWQREAGTGPSGDSDRWTCEVSFTRDADCSLRVEGTDAVGNEASVYPEGTAPQEFTVDMTPPVLEVEFDRDDAGNGRFYNHPKMARVRVREHSFAPSLLEISPFSEDISSEGEVHTAICFFDKDGEYRLMVSCTDLAGNQSAVWSSETFVIDTVPPKIEIGGIVRETVNSCSGEWRPSVFVNDEWLAESSVPLLRKTSGAGGLLVFWEEEKEDGSAAYRLRLFPAVRANDGIWVLQCSAQDLAGNRTERLQKYCINRYGSVFGFSQDPVVVTEANVSPNIRRRITVFREGEVRILREGEEYEIRSDFSGGKYRTQYLLSEECFVQEGYYQIVVQTEDAAGNLCSSAGKGTGANLAFRVDRTAPECRILGVDTEKHAFVTGTLPLRILCLDDGGIGQVRISVRDEQGSIIAERRYGSEEVSEDGIPFLLHSYEGMQTLTAEAFDLTGNAGTAEYSVRVEGPPFHAETSGGTGGAKEIKLPRFLLGTGAVTMMIIIFCFVKQSS